MVEIWLTRQKQYFLLGILKQKQSLGQSFSAALKIKILLVLVN